MPRFLGSEFVCQGEVAIIGIKVSGESGGAGCFQGRRRVIERIGGICLSLSDMSIYVINRTNKIKK